MQHTAKVIDIREHSKRREMVESEIWNNKWTRAAKEKGDAALKLFNEHMEIYLRHRDPSLLKTILAEKDLDT